MHRVERVAADAKGVRLERVPRVVAGFASEKAKVGTQGRRGEDNWIGNGAERGT